MADGAAAFVKAIEQLGVTTIFGLPGVHNLPIWERLADSKIRLCGVRHEQTAVYAADGYARASGRLGVAVATTGPGAANMITATGEAWTVGSPLLVVATDIPTGLRRDGLYRGVLHETRDQAAMFAPVVKEVVRVQTAADIGPLVARAAAKALAAPCGPVYVEIPTDLLSEPCTVAAQVIFESDAPVAPQPAAVRRAAELLSQAERPLIWAGGGVVAAGAEARLAQVAEWLGAPVLETYAARGAMPVGHPCRVGLPPHIPLAGELWDRADVVLAVGTRFDGMMTQNWRMPQPRCLINVNIDPADVELNYRAELPVIADAERALTALATELERYEPKPPWPEIGEIASRYMTQLAVDEPLAAEFATALRDGLAQDAVVVADMCIPGYWAATVHPFPRARRFAYPVGWGTLGFAFPASIGSALGADLPVVCLCGDGGFMFAAGELATVAQEQIPLTILLVDDGGYGMLRFDQEVQGTAPFGVDLVTPDWPQLAGAFGLECEVIDGCGPPLAAALQRHVADRRPSMLVAHMSLKPPPITSPRWYRAQ